MTIRNALFVTLICAFSCSIGFAGDMTEPTDEQATVILDYDGLFIGAPTTSNLVVMEVRVFNADNQLVFRERSSGLPVNLLAVDLPDGKYSYEIVSVLDNSAEVEAEPNVETEKGARSNGRIAVYGGQIIEGWLPNGRSYPALFEEASNSRPISQQAKSLARIMLAALIPSAQAADLEAESANPTVAFTDSDNGDLAWELLGNSSQGGNFGIVDRVGPNNHFVWFSFGEAGSSDNFFSVTIDTDGDIHWANNGMTFDRGLGELAIGTQAPQAGITLYHPTPDILFHDETGTQEALYELSNDEVTFWARPNDSASWDGIFSFNVDAPSDSLRIAPDGNIGMGLFSPARQLHLKGSNAVFRMDRSTNSAAFMLVRTTGGGTPQKTFVVGTNAFGSDNGEFVINDLHTAVAGGGSRRMTINNSGNVNFPGTVTAANIAAPSSRELKKNIAPITDPLELTQQLEGVRFDWRSNDEASLGFIAEDIGEVLPEVVLHDEGTGEMLGVNYAAVVPVLVEAIKEQQRGMDEQKQAIDDQQREIGALKEQLATHKNLASRLGQLEALVAGGVQGAELAHN